MKFDLVPYGTPFHLYLTIQSLRLVNLQLRVFDTATKRVYSQRYLTVNGNSKVLLKLPIVPDRLTVELVEANSPHETPVFRITEINVVKDMKCPDELTEQDKKFITFIKWFACTCSRLETGMIYQSDGFSILYHDKIMEGGIEETTPARIDKVTGLIHVSKNRTKDYTIPMLIVMLIHEYAHLTKNKEYGKAESNELTADLIACHITLNLGFDSYEVRHCFEEVFSRKKTDLNKLRMTAINEFIGIFEANEGNRCKTRRA